MGKTAEADSIMNTALAISTENELNQYGYQLLQSGQQDKAIEIFILNTKKFPKSPNTWDSLGEGYAAKGDKKNAIANFKKVLSMNPPANVRANSEKFLKELGALWLLKQPVTKIINEVVDQANQAIDVNSFSNGRILSILLSEYAFYV